LIDRLKEHTTKKVNKDEELTYFATNRGGGVRNKGNIGKPGKTTMWLACQTSLSGLKVRSTWTLVPIFKSLIEILSFKKIKL
jgi:hypothetical protein